ncbi:MAG: hypothetical protein AAB774_01765 [Patescibacteria group bacterium]
MESEHNMSTGEGQGVEKEATLEETEGIVAKYRKDNSVSDSEFAMLLNKAMEQGRGGETWVSREQDK